MNEKKGSRELERQRLLEEVNAGLAARGLRQLSKLGDAEKGEFEIVSIQEWIEGGKRFFTDVRFGVVFPGGKDGAFTVRFNANGAVSDGAVIVPIVNGMVGLVKQWRLPLQRWTIEVPRGFGDKLDAAKLNGTLGTVQIADLPLGTLTRELGEELMKNATVKSVAHLGNVAENSGTNFVIPAYYLVRIEVDPAEIPAKLKGEEEGLKALLWDIAKVKRELGNKIADNHSIVALSLAFNHLGV